MPNRSRKPRLPDPNLTAISIVEAVIPFVFGNVDFATLIKTYATKGDEHRYSPGEVNGTVKAHCCGNPDPARICTSHVERGNLTIRMQDRRMTRLTNAF